MRLVYEIDGETRVHELTEGEITIGRGADNHLVLKDPALQRHHARLTSSPEGVRITDFASRNGTWVNEQRITESAVECGDVIRLGRSVLRLEETPVASDPISITRATPAAGFRLDDLLGTLRAASGTDLHLVAGQPPWLRNVVSFRPLDRPPLERDWLTGELKRLLGAPAEGRLRERGDATVAHVSPQHGRFRVHVCRQGDHLVATVRAIPATVGSLEALGLPKALNLLDQDRRGLVLVTGPSSSGRSTTVAALLTRLLAEHESHVLTLEQPIEHVLAAGRGFVTQREVGRDVPDLLTGLAEARRSDADAIYAGELHDLEALDAALDLVGAGSSLLATLPTETIGTTLRHLFALWPVTRRRAGRARLAARLRGIVCQQLLPDTSGERRVVAVESIVVDSPRYLDPLRRGAIDELYQTMTSGADKSGAWTMNQSLAKLYLARRITLRNALESSPNSDQLQDMLNRAQPRKA